MYVNIFFIHVFLFKFLHNFKNSNACDTFPDSFFFHGHLKYTILKEKSMKQCLFIFLL